MKHYAGLDISMKETFICVQDETGKVLEEGQVKTNPEHIAKFLQKYLPSLEKAGLESGSMSHFLVRELISLNVPAICIDARKMAAILSIEINKTDKNDARGIATAMRCNLYRQVFLKSEKDLEMKILLKSRKTLVNQRTQLSNSVRGLLKVYGVLLGSCGKVGFAKKVKNALEGKSILAKTGIETLVESYESINKKIDEITKVIEEIAGKSTQVKNLMTIPGVGLITALTFVAEMGDPKRFKKSKSVGAYFGMTPKQYSSGETTKLGRISKCGSAEMRTLLNEAAVVLMMRSKKWSQLKAWGLKIQKRHGYKKACVAVGRKLAIMMHKMMITGKEFVYGKEEKKEEKAA